ncbi:kinase-like protein [Wallemia mellicola]|uniref:protein kinase C n=1 Tax=Wallemia mellicola TaxID=1708541 RepID=A0AB38MSX3_9BASI|nr:kinase-like protein [Wallemia mellicola]TIC41901.1 kinase-like protein [Wallemia mellicola]TIC63557.1 kinase-like protein [Wallemia mellicola]
MNRTSSLFNQNHQGVKMDSQRKELDDKVKSVHYKLSTERTMLDSAQKMRNAHMGNAMARSLVETQIREAQRNVTFFEDTLRDLVERRKRLLERELPKVPGDGDQPPSQPIERESSKRVGKTQISNFELTKEDCPYTPAKVSLMLHQLDYKLAREQHYKAGIEKMAQLYSAEGDKRSRSETQLKKIESDAKMAILRQALRRYQNLYVAPVSEDSGAVDEPAKVDGLRKPLSGTLKIQIKSARDLNHKLISNQSSRHHRQPALETLILIKVGEDTSPVKTRASRSTGHNQWNESFEVPVDKINEVEIAIHERQAGASDSGVPIGLMWIKVSDLVEELRRKKADAEASALLERMNQQGSVDRPGQQLDSLPSVDGPNDLSPKSQLDPTQSITKASPRLDDDGVEGWFSIQPAGAIALKLNFVKQNVRKRPAENNGLGRQGAVRKRKGQVHEMNGHAFVQKQFITNVIKCAYCEDFVLDGRVYRCDDCRYTCHRSCYEKVVTKCVSKQDSGEKDEDKVKHRIPHRLAPISSLTPNWCCHCGEIINPLSKKARKCSDCPVTCHAECAHLLPDFCGMSMVTANSLLRQMQAIGAAKKQPTQKPQPIPSKTPSIEKIDDAEKTTEEIEKGAQKMDITSPQLPVPQPQVPSRQQQQQPQAKPQRVEVPRPYPPPSQQPQAQVPSPTPYSRQHPGQPYRAPPPQFQKQQQVTPKAPQVAPAVQRKVGLDNFNFIAVIGKGNFGKVMLAEEKRSSSLFAIKVLKKEFIIENDEVESTRSEKRVFLSAAKQRHPFLLGLHSCFQTETRIYFVMEYVSGGDLMLHIQRQQFTPRQAKFYASEVLLALEYFHQEGIVYRDLKLDNILLTLDGHVKVADYGLCKENMFFGNTTSTFCGTPEFMAPEILLEQRYGRAVDWWAFGVLIYEMLLGQSPFRGDDEDEIFDAILEDEPLYPIHMPRDSVSLLQRLLTRDPTKRLGAGESDAEEIKSHAYFRDVNFDDVLNKRIPPPFRPSIGSATDISNFDTEFTREQPTLTPVQGQLTESDQAEFAGFSWIAPWAE